MAHQFEVDIAVEYGVNAAVLFQNISFWCAKNKANGHNYFDGRYWTYNSRRAFTELFPYLSERQIKTAIDKLVDDDMLVTGCYNKDPRDRSLWYAVTEKGWCKVQNRIVHYTEMSNAQSEDVTPLPDSNPISVKPDNIHTPYKGAKAPRFTPPTVDEVREYAREKGYSPQEFDPEDFIDFYSSKGWMVGKSKMQNWHSSVSTWVRRYRKEHPAPDPEPTPGPYHDGLTDEERQRKIEEMNEAERRKEWGEDWFERYTKK